MSKKLPSHPVGATLYADFPNWKLGFTRDFAHDPGTVWDAITKADQVAQWMPFRPDHDLVALGDVGLIQTDGSEEELQGRVLEVQPPSSLIYLWGADHLRFDLVPTDTGTSLGFIHTFNDHNSASGIAAGWHLCLAALELLLDGKDVPSVVGENAMTYGWEDLEQEYSALFQDQDDSPEPMDSL